ncbi:DNA-directed RNA polymerase [Frateuria sp. Soil773]|uniref:DNA-directed RNA polymerase n=1 Tax=Frateuria sp. Soil773 TaxID=1736407 RepID=UPI0012FAE1D5|nr:DNA-directed RNA polymerase [Frateuria sp. Soil773]
MTCNVEGTKLDSRRQALGISPNFAHSCDASHMMLSVCTALDKGAIRAALALRGCPVVFGQSASLSLTQDRRPTPRPARLGGPLLSQGSENHEPRSSSTARFHHDQARFHRQVPHLIKTAT